MLAARTRLLERSRISSLEIRKVGRVSARMTRRT